MEHVVDGREGTVGGPDEPQKIEPKMRVMIYGGNIRDTNDVGTVTEISDSDADYDDDLERGVTYPPKVFVTFDNGSKDEFPTSYTGNAGDYEILDPWRCEDLIVLNDGEKVET